jgi:monofunctional biosynthetic peptidoglycan transglycosylase
MASQHPRIEPTLTPRTHAPILEAERQAPSEDMKKKPRSLLFLLYKVLLIGVTLLLLPIVLLKWLPPPTTTYMVQSEVKPVRYTWVPAKNIAEVARRAVVAAEDQKFRIHKGFDVEAIEKAYAHNRKSRHPRGASTISQQTAKNLFLWPGGGYFRKAVEAGITVLIENIWGKDRILEVYLNIAEFGPGIYGVEAASQAYFHKPASQLTATEAARLAAVLPNPRHWKVNTPGAYVQARTSWIVGQMGYGSRDATPSEEPELPASGPESAGDRSDSADYDPAAAADDMPATAPGTAAQPEAASTTEPPAPPANDAAATPSPP